MIKSNRENNNEPKKRVNIKDNDEVIINRSRNRSR